MSERELLLNAFRPGSAIQLPSQFAGRKREISSLVDTLYIDGACPIIFGERGLGKSSLVLQLQRIALGDVELLEELGIPDRALPAHARFVTFSFTCTDGTSTKDELLQRLINTAEGFTDATALPGTTLETKKRTKTIKLKFYEHQVEETHRAAAGRRRFKRLSVEEKFEAITNQINEETKSKVLYIIDELDRVKDTKGFASVIKNLSSTDVKFCLVGVGQNVSALLHDHASLERTLVEVRVSQMNATDTAMIISKAIGFLKESGLAMNFTPDAQKHVVDASVGFPWFVHTIGLECLRRVFDEGQRTVEVPDVDAAIDMLGGRQFAQQFYDVYQMAVRDSSQREIVLRLFALWSGFDIPTSELYSIAEGLGVTNPSAVATQLTTQKYGRVLVRPPYADSSVFRFHNAMFKQYINLRASIYLGVKDGVNKAWDERWKPAGNA